MSAAPVMVGGSTAVEVGERLDVLGAEPVQYIRPGAIAPRSARRRYLDAMAEAKAAGEEVYDHFRAALDALQAAAVDMADIRTLPVGVLELAERMAETAATQAQTIDALMDRNAAPRATPGGPADAQ